MSTAVTYLDPARRRPNLSIRPDTMAAYVELAGTRATGVRLLDGTVIEADQVVLAAGTYASPMILARSGIGPAAELHALGIDCVVDLPGVGSNLVDHPLISDRRSDSAGSRPESLPSPSVVPLCGRRRSPDQPTCCCSRPARSTPDRTSATAAPCSASSLG